MMTTATGSSAGPPVRRARTSTKDVVFLLLGVTMTFLTQAPSEFASAAASSSPSSKLLISSAGINVPKRPTLIAGLNQQFSGRSKLAASSNSSSGLPTSSSSSVPSHKVGGLLAAALSVSPFAKSQQQQANKQQLANLGAGGPLYLDRHQQELLAANPTIPLTSSNLLTRSDISGGGQSSALMDYSSSSGASRMATSSSNGEKRAQGAASNQQQQQLADGHLNQAQVTQQQQQSYRGYSLIELEVKSELDRRYVQDLYGNLSAALNEQAQRPASSSGGGGGGGGGIGVSPYVDIDFWSFKCALNDQIDIMVSPKSRAFILNQLGRAKIKHRIKIDDIQAKLDAQQPPLQQQAGAQSGGNGELSGRQSASNQQLQQQQASASGDTAKSKQQFGGHSSSADQLLNGRQQQQQQQQNDQQQPTRQVDPFAGSHGMNDSLFFENYQRLADINQYLESVVARARDIARVQVIGRSSQGRYLRVLRLGYEQSDLDGTTGPLMNGRTNDDDDAAAEFSASSTSDGGDGHAQKLAGKQQPPIVQNASMIVQEFFRRQQAPKKLGSIWLDGGTHAREWISPATVLYISFRLADNHARCMRFFDYLNMVVSQQQVTVSAFAGRSGAATLSGGGSNARQPTTTSQSPLDADLLLGINEINTSLLAGQHGPGSGGGGAGAQVTLKLRPRTELEQKLELLAKRPQEVASEHACDLDMEQLLRKYTFYIEPVLNPDGYEYSHTHNRLWRKTRSTSAHPIYRHFCLGADPNRNYDARHGSTGSSSHPCSQTYGGTTPFTEPETRHQSNFVYAHRDSLKMFISFHSYSQMILLPFSHSKQLAPDHKDLESVGQAGVKAIERTHGTQYRVGPSASILYTASGTASDWAYEKAGIKYSYTIELRDTGTFGFLLPRQQIIPTGEETFNGLLAMIAQMEKNDNLLTSKSSSASGGSLQANSGAADGAQQLAANNSTNGFVHAPDLDQLRPFGRFRPRPAQLENALDGSDTWATPEPRVPGVRNRGPPAVAAGSGAFASPADRILEGEIIAASDAEEPDAGLAFEGEGELMEPTNNMSVESALAGQSSDAAAESAAKLMGHIYAHSTSSNAHAVLHDRAASDLLGRQMSTSGSSAAATLARQRFASNQLGLSANGRSLINSPPAPARATASTPRRENSSANAKALSHVS